MLFRSAREKRRVGERDPSRCMWCSHFGIAARKGWKAVRHMMAGHRIRYNVSGATVNFNGTRWIVKMGT